MKKQAKKHVSILSRAYISCVQGYVCHMYPYFPCIYIYIVKNVHLFTNVILFSIFHAILVSIRMFFPAHMFTFVCEHSFIPTIVHIPNISVLRTSPVTKNAPSDTPLSDRAKYSWKAIHIQIHNNMAFRGKESEIYDRRKN